MAKMNLVLCGAVGGLLLFHAGGANGANVIAQIDASFGFGAASEGQPPSGLMYLVFQHDSDTQRFVALRPSLFEDIPITPQTIGQQYVVNAKIDPDFPAIVDHLTNGIDETLLIWQFEQPDISGPGSSWIQKESGYLGPAGNPDLVGHEIRALVMTVVDYRHDVILPTVGRFDFVDVAILVLGVPEPTSAGLLGMGLMPFLLVSRRTCYGQAAC